MNNCKIIWVVMMLLLVGTMVEAAEFIARIVKVETGARDTMPLVRLKIEAGTLVVGDELQLLTPAGVKGRGKVTEMKGGGSTIEMAMKGDEVQAKLALNAFLPDLATLLVTAPNQFGGDYSAAQKALAKPDARPLPSTGSGPVQFTCRYAGADFSCRSGQSFQIGRGPSEYITSQKNDLLAWERMEAGEPMWTSQPVAGSVQMIEKVKADESITIVLGLAAPYPDDPYKFLRVTLAIKGLTRSALGKLPLNVPVQAKAKGSGRFAAMMVEDKGAFLEGISGEVEIEAIDYRNRIIRGTFTAVLKGMGIGAPTRESELKIEKGWFAIDN